MSVAYSMGPISFEEIGTLLSLNPKASPGKLSLATVLLLYLPLATYTSQHSSENGCFTCFLAIL